MLDVLEFMDATAPVVSTTDPVTGKPQSFRPPRKLCVGSQADYEAILTNPFILDQWAFVHACKEPHHREMLGYEGRAAPKDHPEYLFGYRGPRLVLNLVDVDDPQYVRPEIIDAAVAFIDLYVRGENKRNVLVHCNQGKSRSPTIAMLYLGMRGDLPPTDFDFAESEFRRNHYPDYAPARGMREYARANWQRYTIDKALGEAA